MQTGNFSHLQRNEHVYSPQKADTE